MALMKKLLIVAAAAASAVLYRKWQVSNNRRATWSSATDKVD
jgi:hypothetical protein